VRRLRLASGLVLFTYLITHFANHALGNISLAAMEEGLEYHVIVWQGLPGTLLLYSALTVHAALGLWALYERRHFRWRVIEGVQLVTGLSIPFLLAAHVVGQRVALEVFGVERAYAQALHLFLGVVADSRHVAGARADCRVGAWLHRRVLLAAAEAVLQVLRIAPFDGGSARPHARAARASISRAELSRR
jgi:hypothetical protein